MHKSAKPAALRLALAVMMLGLAFGLGACSHGSQSYRWGTLAKLAGFEVKVSAPMQTGTFVGVNLSIKNTDSEQVSFDLLAAILQDRNKHDHAAVSFSSEGPSASATLSSGQTLSGTLAFYLPTGAQPTLLVLPEAALGTSIKSRVAYHHETGRTRSGGCPKRNRPLDSSAPLIGRG